jgi:hypothetical protein
MQPSVQTPCFTHARTLPQTLADLPCQHLRRGRLWPERAQTGCRHGDALINLRKNPSSKLELLARRSLYP